MMGKLVYVCYAATAGLWIGTSSSSSTTTTKTSAAAAFNTQQHSIFSRRRRRTKNDEFQTRSFQDIPSDNDDDGVHVSFQRKLELIRRDYDNLTVEQIQKQWVYQGTEHRSSSSSSSSSSSFLPIQRGKVSPPTKVTGCTAHVVIQVCLTVNLNDEKDKAVQVKGTCDALVSRGMLRVWTNLCEGATVSDILQVDPFKIADLWGWRKALSPGRNDGLASLVRTTQTLLRTLQQQQPQQATTLLQQQAALLQQTNTPRRRPTVALLLSGGVDSSVALHLLLEQGYDVTCFYLKIWLQDELSHLGACPWEDDVQMCQRVCNHFHHQVRGAVKFETISLQSEYHQHVISHTLHEARQGRTPNPDILCNSRIKFGCFYQALVEQQQQQQQQQHTKSFDYIATGHYAQLIRKNNETDEVTLVRAPDPVKDQSYFLCALTQQQLRRVLFPIGHLQKSQVRQLALDLQLPNRHRPDSQGLCFLGKVKFCDFIQAYLGECPGDIIDAATGEIIGRHKGLWFHTVGQRKGIGTCLNPLATAKGPWYVVAKDPPANIVYCSNQYDEKIFEQPRSEFTVEDISWIAGQKPTPAGQDGCYHFDFKIRHGPRLVSGTFSLLNNNNNEGRVRLDHKDGGLAPGQYVVFYRPKTAECLGSGIISERHWAEFLLQREQQQHQQPQNLSQFNTTTLITTG